MYQDYLKAGFTYKEDYPSVNLFPIANKVLKQKERQRKKRKKPKNKHKNYIVNSILQNKKSSNSENAKHFKVLTNHSNSTLKGASSLLKGFEKMLGIALLAGLALFGITKYLDIKESQYDKNDEEFSGLSTGHISEEGKEQIKKDEGGFKEKAYWDKNGYSIGYGHHGLINGKPIQEGQTITKEEADRLFDEDIKIAENQVKRQLKKNGITTPVSQRQFDSMVNYVYNSGHLGSIFLSKLKQGDYKAAALELEVGGENTERMAEIQRNFMSDVGADNKLKGGVENLNQSTNHPVAQTGGEIGTHKLKSDKVQVSDVGKEYLKNINSDDIITSGMDGQHDTGYRNGVKVYDIVHPGGLKLDVVPKNISDESWVNTAIAYIKHPYTAYVNFEDFSTSEFESLKSKIFSKISPDLQAKCNKTHKWFFGATKTFLFRSGANANTTGKHLDIGILPNISSAKTSQENKTLIKNEESKNIQQAKTNNNELKKQPTSSSYQKPSDIKDVKQPTIIKTNKEPPKNTQTMYNAGMKHPYQQIKEDNYNYIQARK